MGAGSSEGAAAEHVDFPQRVCGNAMAGQSGSMVGSCVSRSPSKLTEMQLEHRISVSCS